MLRVQDLLLNLQFVLNKSSSSLEIELEKEEKHKVDDAVTVDKKHSDNKNDIQRSEEEGKQLKPTATTNTVL